MDKVLMILLGSLIVLIQTCVIYYDSFWWTFAAAISGISVVLCVTLMLIKRRGTAKTDNVASVIVGILVAMWLCGTACMTVKAPYTHTGNGYLGAWVALVFSWLLAVQHFPSLKAPFDDLASSGGNLMAMLFLASLVVFCQTLWLVIDHRGFRHGEVVWLLVCSGFSLFALLFMRVKAGSEVVRNNFYAITLFLYLWWCVGWFVGTFDAPYGHTGNGFFGCWVALIASFLLADSARGLRLQQRAEGAAAAVPRALFGLALGSVVVLIAVTYNGCWGGIWCTWALICSCVSTVTSLFLCVVIGSGSSDKVSSAVPYISIFLLIWWLAGTGIMTFEHPFTATSNGYFGAWLALVCATILCHDHVQSLKAALGRLGSCGNLLVLLLLASVTLLIQVLFDTLDEYKHDNLEVAWIAGAGSLSVCLIMMLSRTREDVMRVLVVVMLLLWTVGVGVLTFDAPYIWTGNAYFALWFGFALSSLAVWRQYPDCASKMAPGAGGPPPVVVGGQQIV